MINSRIKYQFVKYTSSKKGLQKIKIYFLTFP